MRKQQQFRSIARPAAVALPWHATFPAQIGEQIARRAPYVLGISARVGLLLALLYATLG